MNPQLRQLIRRLAARNHGVITREELLDAGVPASAINEALRYGHLLLAHPGVYIVAGVPDLWESGVLAATRYVHRQARRRDPELDPVVAAAGTTAGRLHGLGGLHNSEDIILVTNPLSRSKAALIVHAPQLRADELVVIRGIPATDLAWTLVETASVVSDPMTENLLGEAIRSRKTSVEELLDVAHRSDSAGAPVVTRLLRTMNSLDLQARSGSERRVTRAVVAAGHPPPEVNQRILAAVAAHELDMYWSKFRLNVEIEGPHHDLPDQRRRDRRRDKDLTAVDIHVERIPVSDVDDDLPGVVERIADLIAIRHRHVAGEHGICPAHHACQQPDRDEEVA